MTPDEARAIAMHQLRLIEEYEGGGKLLRKVMAEAGPAYYYRETQQEGNGHGA